MVEPRAFASAVWRIIRPLRNRVLVLARLAKLALVRDELDTQELQVIAHGGEVLDRVKAILPYGFTHHPIPGSEVVILALGGSASNTVAVVVGGRVWRLKALAEGEGALHDDPGQNGYLKRSGIVVESPLNILIKTPGVLRLEGDGVEIHGHTYIQTDIHGKGQRETWVGGASYRVDTWTTGALGVPGAEYGLDQPSIPSDHPEASG